MDDKKKNKYLYDKYGTTLEKYNKELEAQGGGCKICGSKPITRSLPVDHDHKLKYLKVKTEKIEGDWFATIPEFGIKARSWKPKRNDAIREVRQKAKELSIRGIICVGCNTGLRKFKDNPLFLEAAAKYLRLYQEKLIGQ